MPPVVWGHHRKVSGKIDKSLMHALLELADTWLHSLDCRDIGTNTLQKFDMI